MTFLHPVWLLLAVPLIVSLWVWRLPSRFLLALRILALVLVLLALAGLAIRIPGQAGTVVIVADRSLSMPAQSEANQKEAVDLISRGKSIHDQVAVVSFGEKIAIEKPPHTEAFPGFNQEVGPNASNLSEAIETAMTLIPEDAPGRILVLSDGRWTGNDPLAKSSSALARNIGIDYRSLERPMTNDLAVLAVDAPPNVNYKESFLISALVQSPVPRDAICTLSRDGKVIASMTRSLKSGPNRIVFRDQANQEGNQSYAVSVTAAGDAAADPVPENNQAKFLVGVGGPRPIYHVSTTKGSGLARLLGAGGLDVRSVTPDQAKWDIEHLSRHSAVILENVPAEKIGATGMGTLASWVRATGSGLMITGGKNSYGPGGYYKSPLDPIMPVTMELRNEHRKLALAIVVALDRSGSMAMPVPGGRQKMDLANLGAAEVLEMLGPTDEFGCIAVDSMPHEVVPLSTVTDKGASKTKILGIQSMGGGIFVYQALLRAADIIKDAKAGTKHIILFSDAADAEEPGNYKELLEKLDKAGITVSVIGLGTDRDKDAEFLKDVAKRGKGRIFFTDKPEELPRVFAQDTFVVARSTFLDDPVGIRNTPGMSLLTEQPPVIPATLKIGGYNLCYLRPTATLGTVTLDEYKAPVTASWRVGSGRVVCYTGEADGQFAGPIARWDKVGDYFTSLARWVSGSNNPLSSNMLLTQEIRDGASVVTLNLDPERTADPFSGLPQATILRAKPNEPTSEAKATLRWTGADTLEVQTPLEGTGMSVVTVEVPGENPISLAPVCLPYSPEYKPSVADRGTVTLEKLARATGGQERLELPGIWKDLPQAVRFVNFANWLLLGAVVVLVAEVFQRRTNWLTSWVPAPSFKPTARAAMRAEKIKEEKSKAAANSQAKAKAPPAAPPVPAAAPMKPAATANKSGSADATAPKGDDILEALRKARERRG